MPKKHQNTLIIHLSEAPTVQGKAGRTRVRRSTTAGRARDTRSHLTMRLRCRSSICLLCAPFEWPVWELQGHLTLTLRGALTRLPPRLPRWRQAGPPSSRHGPGRAAPACPGASLHPRTPGAAGSPSAAQRPGQRGVSNKVLLETKCCSLCHQARARRTSRRRRE